MAMGGARRLLLLTAAAADQEVKRKCVRRPEVVGGVFKVLAERYKEFETPGKVGRRPSASNGLQAGAGARSLPFPETPAAA